MEELLSNKAKEARLTKSDIYKILEKAYNSYLLENDSVHGMCGFIHKYLCETLGIAQYSLIITFSEIPLYIPSFNYELACSKFHANEESKDRFWWSTTQLYHRKKYFKYLLKLYEPYK